MLPGAFRRNDRVGDVAALVWCPFPSEEAAVAAADTLLSEGLVACVNLLPAMRSLYVWQGERGEAQECGALFKTNQKLLAATVKRLEAIHPYDAPAIVGWHGGPAGSAATDWLGALPGRPD